MIMMERRFQRPCMTIMLKRILMISLLSLFAYSNCAHATLSFAENRQFTIDASAGPNGTISPSGKDEVPGGTNRKFTITAAAGYRIADAIIDGVSKGAVSSYTFYNIQDNHTISASFALDVYNITAVADAHGSITPSGTYTVKAGGSADFTITPEAGFKVKSVIVDNLQKGDVSRYTFQHVVANHTIHAYFKPITYTITASADVDGTISTPGVNTVNPGSNMTFKLTPNDGYHVSEVLVDGRSRGVLSSYTFTSIAANHTISATFAENTWVIIDASAGPNGTISSSGRGSVLSGTNQKYIITPAAEYRVADVIIDGVSRGALTSYTFYSVQGDHTISAAFVLDTYAVDITADTGGTVALTGTMMPTAVVNGGETATLTVKPGDAVTLAITPDAGHQVRSVIDNGSAWYSITTHTLTNIRSNHSISVYFK